MPPQQTPRNPYPSQPQPGASNQYDFIMNPQAPKRPSLTPGSPKGLLFVVGAAALVIIMLVVIISLFRGGGQSSTPYLKVAQEQQEMARVADLQYDSLQQERTKDFAVTTKLTMTTDQTTLTTFLGQRGVKLNSKQVALGVNSATDAKLTQAVSTSSLDGVLTAELQQELTAYRGSLQQAYAATSSASVRALLKQLDNHAQLLLTQSNQ